MLPQTQLEHQETSTQDFRRIDSILAHAMETRVTNVHRSIELAQKAEFFSRSLNYENGLACSLNQLGLFHMIIGEHNEANVYVTEALALFQTLGDKNGLAEALYTLGSIHYKSARHHIGLEKLLESLKWHKETENISGQSRTLKAIGFIYETFRESEKALETYLECRRLSQLVGDKNGESNACNPLSGLYLKQGDFENAFEAIDASIRLKQNSGDKRGLAFAYYGKAKIYLRRHELNEAEKLFRKSLNTHRQVSEKLGTAMCHIKLGVLCFEKAELNESEENLHEAIKVGRQIDNKEILSKAYFQLFRIAKKKGDQIKALDYHVAYHDMRESILNTETSSRIKSLETMYKLESLENEARAQRDKNEIIQKKNEELDKFVSRVSHDLKGPISSLLALYPIVQEDIENSDALHYFELYNNQLVRLNQTVIDLLDLSKVNSLDLLSAEINFESLVRDCMDSYRHYPNYSKIKFEIKIEEGFAVKSDRRLVNTIIQNLIENGIKYCDLEKDEPWVSISILKNSEESFQIAVQDNGIGIDEKYQSKVFNMFFRANETAQGSGLGMFILKNAVEKLSGELILDSKLGVGTKVVAFLPIMH